jgi:hypothetical protein
MSERTPDEVLKNLLEATDEARKTIADLHTARRDLLEVQKRQERRITDLLIAEVDNAVKALRTEARDEMRSSAKAIIDKLAADWRERLGLS